MSAGFVERFDDSLNPIVVKELRQAVQSRFVVITLLLFLALQLLVLGVWVLFRLERTPGEDMDFGLGREIFLVLHSIMLGMCLLFIPLYAGIRLASERSDTNVDLLFVTALKPRAIIRGKLFAAVVLLLLIFSACAPFLTFTYLLRGIDIPTILMVLAIDFLAVVAGIQAAMFIAVIPATRVSRAFLGLTTLGGLLMLFTFVVGGTATLAQYGIQVPLDSIEFWGVTGITTFLWLASIGLLFVWSVAVVNPPSANRALPMRIYVAVVWLLAGAAFGYWALHNSSIEPFYTWVIGGVLIFCLQFIISINEREHWAPRVARTIPRNPLLRAAAFMFYSGSAGGVIYSILGAVGTLLIGKGMADYLSPGFARTGDDVLRGMTLLSLYVLAYGMTAVFVRRWLLASTIRPVHTWVLMAVLIALGSAVPYIMGFLIYYDDRRTANEYYWLIANPFYALFDTRNSDYYLIFAQVWATIAVLVNVPWFIRQIQRFRPHRS